MCQLFAYIVFIEKKNLDHFFKKFVSRSDFWQAPRHIDISEFHIDCCNFKIRSLKKNVCGFFLFMVPFLDIPFSIELYPIFSCEKTILNITHDRKGISEFP